MDWETTDASHGTSKPLWLWAEGPEEICPHARGNLGAAILGERRAHRVNSIKSYRGKKEKQLSGYGEVAGSTSEGIELHRLIILCALLNAKLRQQITVCSVYISHHLFQRYKCNKAHQMFRTRKCSAYNRRAFLWIYCISFLQFVLKKSG